MARYVANNLGVLDPTFSRYQIGQIFRGENPQKGRYREFTQFDFDTVGSVEPEEDAKVIAAAIKAIRALGLSQAQMAVNDRQNFKDLPAEDIRAIDKIYKLGKENTEARLLTFVENSKPTRNLSGVFEILKTKYNLNEGVDFFFDPTLARGLDYYTSSIFELKPTGKPEDLTIGGGGRYDNLIGVFAGRDIPAVGFSFGLDRLTELL